MTEITLAVNRVGLCGTYSWRSWHACGRRISLHGCI